MSNAKRSGMSLRVQRDFVERPPRSGDEPAQRQTDGLKKRGETSRRGTLRAWRAEDPAP